MPKVKVEFPITRDIIEGRQHVQRTLYENDKVKCWFCNRPIILDFRHTHMAEDGMQMVDCPSCKRSVSVLYYFDRVENRKRDPIKVAHHRRQRVRNGGN